jgi:hypothetical protein
MRLPHTAACESAHAHTPHVRTHLRVHSLAVARRSWGVLCRSLFNGYPRGHDDSMLLPQGCSSLGASARHVGECGEGGRVRVVNRGTGGNMHAAHVVKEAHHTHGHSPPVAHLYSPHLLHSSIPQTDAPRRTNPLIKTYGGCLSTAAAVREGCILRALAMGACGSKVLAEELEAYGTHCQV